MTADKWDLRFLSSAREISSWSKDPRRKVGCVIIDDDYNQLSGGFNGFPRGIADDHRLDDRPVKNRMIVHAEANAVAAAARNGHSLKDATVYITHAPCPQCACLLIQAGVVRVVYSKQKDSNPEDEEDFALAVVLLKEACVHVDRIDL